MENLIKQLSEEEIVKHLTPVEQRLYRSSDRLRQLEVVRTARCVTTIGMIVEEAVKRSHPADKIFNG